MLSPIARVIRSTASGSNVAASAERRREHRRAEGGEAGEALLVRDRRQAEARALDQLRLEPGEPPRPLDRVDRARAERPGEVAHAVGARLLERRRVRERLLHGRDVARARAPPRSTRWRAARASRRASSRPAGPRRAPRAAARRPPRVGARSAAAPGRPGRPRCSGSWVVSSLGDRRRRGRERRDHGTGLGRRSEPAAPRKGRRRGSGHRHWTTTVPFMKGWIRQ